MKEMKVSQVRTYSPKAGDADKKWYVIDATDQVLGRLSAQIAAILRGKNKATFAPHMDMGDYVIVINADKVVLTGNKASKKKYYDHSGYPGGLRTTSYTEMIEGKPERVVERAIRGMLPKNSLGRDQFRKLKVYAGGEHPHAAQQPTTYAIGQVAQ